MSTTTVKTTAPADQPPTSTAAPRRTPRPR